MITVDDICKLLHVECYGPWHGEGSHMYMEFETHHKNQHIVTAKRIYLAIHHGMDKAVGHYLFED